MTTRRIDMVGRRVGLLQVVALAPPRYGNTRWLCRCDCGATVERYGSDLRQQKIHSCGCARRADPTLPARVKELYLGGASIATCARVTHYSQAYIWNILAAQGVPRRVPSSPRTVSTARLLRLYEQEAPGGWGVYSRIARAAGIQRGIVRRRLVPILKARGLPYVWKIQKQNDHD